jgi:hypothetical protein
MISLTRSPTRLTAPKRSGYRALWLACATWVIGSIAGATVAMANVPVGEWSPDMAPFSTEALTPLLKSGCHTCEVVEIINTPISL